MIGFLQENVLSRAAKPKMPPSRPKIAPEAPTAGVSKPPKYSYAIPPERPQSMYSAKKRARPNSGSTNDPRKKSETMFRVM